MGIRRPSYSEYSCPVCGKDFTCYEQGQWAYRGTFDGKPMIFCSWKCIQEKRHRQKEKRRKKDDRGVSKAEK